MVVVLGMVVLYNVGMRGKGYWMGDHETGDFLRNVEHAVSDV